MPKIQPKIPIIETINQMISEIITPNISKPKIVFIFDIIPHYN